MAATATDPLKAHAFRRQRLLDIIRQLSAVVIALEDSSLTVSLATLDGRVASDTFKVMMLGVFRNGKNMLINAMLGCKVLPADARPGAGLVNEVKYGDRPRAVLHSRDGTPPLEVPVDQLARAVAIDEENPDRPSPYRLAEVFWPLELCRDGVEIVDSSGLNEEDIREQVTGGYLSQADAIVFVLGAITPFAETDRRFLENFVLPLGHERVFFVCNRISQVAPDEHQEFIAAATRRLSRTGRAGQAPAEPGIAEAAIRPDRLFFLDAIGALDGRLNGAQTQVFESALPSFEAALQSFLTQEKGKLKLLAPARELWQRLVRTRELIKDRERMYDQDLQDLIDAYEAARPKLGALEQRRKIIISRLDDDIRAVEAAVADSARGFLQSLAAQCPAWAKNARTEARITVSLTATGKQLETVTTELASLLDDRIQSELRHWQAQILEPLLAERLAVVQEQLEQDITEYVDQARAVQLTIADATAAGIDPGIGPATERVLTGAAGLFLMDIGLGYSGARFGAMSMLKAAMPQIAALIATIALGFSPLAITAALLSSSVIQSVSRMGKLNSKVKQQIGEAIGDQLERAIPHQARALGRQVAARLHALSEQVDVGLRAETDTVREQVEAAIRDKQVGEATVARRRAELTVLLADVESIDQARGELVHDIALA